MRLNGTNITRLLLIHVLQSKFLKRVGVSTQICFQYLSLSPKPKKEKYIFRVLDDKINYFIKIPLRDTPLQRTEHLNCEYIYRSVTVLFEMIQLYGHFLLKFEFLGWRSVCFALSSFSLLCLVLLRFLTPSLKHSCPSGSALGRIKLRVSLIHVSGRRDYCLSLVTEVSLRHKWSMQ